VSVDSDHLSFHKSDVLEVVKQESSGWWAAVRGNGTEVGWIPASYVKVLSNEAAEQAYVVREQTQIPNYDRDNGSRSAPPSLKRDPASEDDDDEDDEDDDEEEEDEEDGGEYGTVVSTRPSDTSTSTTSVGSLFAKGNSVRASQPASPPDMPDR
jgi:hypothetical protein